MNKRTLTFSQKDWVLDDECFDFFSVSFDTICFFSEWFQFWEILFASSILPNLCTSCCYYSWLVARFDDLTEEEDVACLESNVDSVGLEIDSQDT